MSNLDESRRHGVPIDPRHRHPPPQLSTLNETRSSISDDIPTNGWHSNVEYSLQQKHQNDNPPSTTYHVPQHLQQHQPQPAALQPLQPPPPAVQPDRIPSSSSSPTAAKDLDGELSGLQAAAAKTALLIHGKATRSSLDGEVVTVTTEEGDDDKSSHWIFRRHVGFSIKEETEAILHHPPPSFQDENHGYNSNGVADKLYQQSAQSALSPPIEANAAENDSADQTEKTHLLQQLNTLQRQRRHLQTTSPTLSEHLNEWDFRLSSAQQTYQNAVSTLEAVSAKRIWAEEEYQSTCKWHVLGDVFLIWHRGPFGTINGIRLGKSALTMVGLMKKCLGSGGGGGSGAGGAGQTARSGGGERASLFSWGASSENNGTSNSRTPLNNNNTNGSGNTTNPKDATLEKAMIPWNEINSALGQVVFLLYTLQHAPYSGISFRKHILQPCGSASKIGILKKNALSNNSPSAQRPRNERRRITALAAYYNTGSSTADNTPSSKSNAQPKWPTSSKPSFPTPLPGEVTWYNLHHYEENGSLLSMGYYARRNFNTALEGLLYCIAEACFMVEKRDMALSAPYIMRVDGLVVGKDVYGNESGVGGGNSGGGGANTKDGEATVGGLPLAYDPVAGEQWTMVCKYLLTNLKWLIAYSARHVDR